MIEGISILTVLVYILIGAIVVWALNLFIGMLNLDPRIKQIAWAIIGIIGLVFLLRLVGINI